eukprot:m.117689 g.117689  ORF g.117689 m.117689 type:complete len:202 (+) comp14257_c0_seq1:2955-3560(+)
MQAAARDVKICVLGNSSVGKSCLAIQYVNGIFTKDVQNTIGAAFLCKTVDAGPKGELKMQIWDTAGAEKYRGLAPMYYRGCAAAIVVYDITSRDSFEAVKSWVEELQTNGPNDVILVVAGNKADLESSRAIPTDEAKAYAKGINASFFETSAMTGVNVEDVFQDIAQRIPESKLPGPKKVLHVTTLEESPKTSRWRLCSIL